MSRPSASVSSLKILRGSFVANARAIELWWDEDKDLLSKPWAKENPTSSSDYLIWKNSFERDVNPLLEAMR